MQQRLRSLAAWIEVQTNLDWRDELAGVSEVCLRRNKTPAVGLASAPANPTAKVSKEMCGLSADVQNYRRSGCEFRPPAIWCYEHSRK